MATIDVNDYDAVKPGEDVGIRDKGYKRLPTTPVVHGMIGSRYNQNVADWIAYPLKATTVGSHYSVSPRPETWLKHRYVFTLDDVAIDYYVFDGQQNAIHRRQRVGFTNNNNDKLIADNIGGKPVLGWLCLFWDSATNRGARPFDTGGGAPGEGDILPTPGVNWPLRTREDNYNNLEIRLDQELNSAYQQHRALYIEGNSKVAGEIALQELYEQQLLDQLNQEGDDWIGWQLLKNFDEHWNNTSGSFRRMFEAGLPGKAVMNYARVGEGLVELSPFGEALALGSWGALEAADAGLDAAGSDLFPELVDLPPVGEWMENTKDGFDTGIWATINLVGIGKLGAGKYGLKGAQWALAATGVTAPSLLEMIRNNGGTQGIAAKLMKLSADGIPEDQRAAIENEYGRHAAEAAELKARFDAEMDALDNLSTDQLTAMMYGNEAVAVFRRKRRRLLIEKWMPPAG